MRYPLGHQRHRHATDNATDTGIQWPGYPAHSTSTGVSRLASPIFWYRSLIVSAFRPCHGRLPRRKYINRWPSDSRSSLRLCSANIKPPHSEYADVNNTCRYSIPTYAGCSIKTTDSLKQSIITLHLWFTKCSEIKLINARIKNRAKFKPYIYKTEGVQRQLLVWQNSCILIQINILLRHHFTSWTYNKLKHTVAPPGEYSLTTADVSANAHVSSSTGQVLVLSVRYVLVCNGIEVLLRKPKVHDVNDMFATSRSPSD